jgi:hypothetical protein
MVEYLGGPNTYRLSEITGAAQSGIIMTKLMLRFAFRTGTDGDSFTIRYHGPLFHRWLPDGEKDALIFDTGNTDVELKVWFERLGFTKDEFIVFDKKRHEVDPDTMVKQAVLDAGPLYGLVTIESISAKELDCLQNNRIGDETYIALGKRIVNLIYPSLSRLLGILRTNYGQFWIPELEKWDSRKMSLGSYCLRLNIQWSVDEGVSWSDFRPNEPIGNVAVVMPSKKSFLEYLTEEDWKEIGLAIEQGYQPSLPAFLASRTNQLLNDGNTRYALIEGVTALEIAIDDFIRRQLNGDDLLVKSVQSFWTLPLSARVIVVANTLDAVSLDDLKSTVRAIEERNTIVHEGKEPDENAAKHLRGLLNVIATLIPGPKFKFPSSSSGNALMPVEEWEKLKKD